MKIALLYVGIGRYICFWNQFYESCEKYFLPEAEKHYFFVTDNINHHKTGDNVTYIYQDDLGWPCNAMYKFAFFLRKREILEKYDYLFLCNANMCFKTTISSKEVIPSEKEDYLTMLTWQSQDAEPDTFPFERRQQSATYIAYGTKQIYYQAGFCGGRSKEFLQLLSEGNQLIQQDLLNGYVPLWHDESALNKYMLGRKCKLLENEYGRAEHRDKKHDAKIIFTTKEKMLGRSWMRNFKKRKHTDTWLRKLLKKMRIVS